MYHNSTSSPETEIFSSLPNVEGLTLTHHCGRKRERRRSRRCGQSASRPDQVSFRDDAPSEHPRVFGVYDLNKRSSRIINSGGIPWGWGESCIFQYEIGTVAQPADRLCARPAGPAHRPAGQRSGGISSIPSNPSIRIGSYLFRISYLSTPHRP